MFLGVTAAAGGAAIRGGLSRLHFAPAAAGEMVREALHASHAHGAFLLLASCDVLLARHLLSPQQASLFGVGAVVARVALWLPQTVVGVFFAGLARAAEHASTARRCAALVGGIGAVTTIGTAVLGRLVVSVVGGAQFHALDSTIWLFALGGSLLSIVQVALLAGLAQRRTRQVAAVWFTLAADVTLAFTLSGGLGATGLAMILAVVAAGSAGYALDVLIAARRHRRANPDWLIARGVVTSS
jgi:O-antigen/teichoic acid export membrane protein